MRLESVVIPVTTTGGAGVSAGTNRAGIPNGFLRGLKVDYHASAPATTDVTITASGPGGEQTLYSKLDSNTDFPMRPIKVPVYGTDGNAITGEYEAPVVSDMVTVNVAQSNNLAPAVTVTLVIEVG